MLLFVTRVVLRWACLFFCAAVAAQGGPHPPPAAPPPTHATPPLSSQAIAAIASVLQGKRARTAIEAKVDSNILYATRALAARDAGDATTAPPEFVRNFTSHNVDADNTIVVTIRARVSPALVAALRGAGATEVNDFTPYDTVTARLSLARVLDIAARPEVRSIAPLERGATNVYVPRPGERMPPRVRFPPVPGKIGRVTSEGVVAHGADKAIAAGADGTGVKVCVLSDGIDALAAGQASGDLGPVDVIADANSHGNEGTAMLQIVHDTAPGAALGFVTAYGGMASMASHITSLRSAHGCDILVDDFTYFIEAPFQDDLIAQAVNAVVADGALYFSSAANSGNETHNRSGTWEGDFADSGQTLTLIDLAEGRHVALQAFGGSAYNRLKTAGRGIVLSWAEPIDGATSDYDLFVLDPSGVSIVSQSSNVGSKPWEFIDCSDLSACPANARIVVAQFSGVAGGIRLDTVRGELTVHTAGSTFGHNAAASAVTVAATYAGNSGGGLFLGGVQDPVESFSSDGPRRIFFRPDGSPITPGNLRFGTNGGQVLQKPDLTAADGVVTTLVPPYNPFFGTSAAAPHAAALAALVRSAKPSASAAEMRTALVNSALDIEMPGVDRDSGVGIAMAPASVRSVLSPLVVAAALAPAAITAGAVSTLTVTVSNANSIALRSISFTDNLPSGVQVATPPLAQIAGAGCTGVLTASPGGAVFALSGGVVPAGGTCSYRVDLTSFAPGTYAGSTGVVATPIALDAAAVPVTLSVLPALSAGFTFTPIAPCRIVDTRNALGPIAAGTSRVYAFYTGDPAATWSGQGGAAGPASSACPGTTLAAAGGALGRMPPIAAVLTITAANTTAAGNFSLWSGIGPPASGSTVNWPGAGSVVANTSIVTAGGRVGGAIDFAIFYNGPDGQADAIVDIVGYIGAAAATPVQCTTQIAGGAGTHASGSAFGLSFAACPNGYTAADYGCSSAAALPGKVYLQEIGATSGRCTWFNQSGSPVDAGGYRAETVCCRVPGQ